MFLDIFPYESRLTGLNSIRNKLTLMVFCFLLNQLVFYYVAQIVILNFLYILRNF